MKNQPLLRRTGFALNGLAAALRHEASFRAHLAAAICALTVTLWLNPPLLWWAIVAVIIALVLAVELINTALEHALDALHPQPAPPVKIAKDCAAAAVLVLSIAAIVVFLLMLYALQLN